MKNIYSTDELVQRDELTFVTPCESKHESTTEDSEMSQISKPLQISQYTPEYLEKWKTNEIENYNRLLLMKNKTNKTVKYIGNYVLDLITMKDIFFKEYRLQLGSNVMSNFVVLCSNIFTTYLTLGDIVNKVHSILFMKREDENYEFVPYRLLMRQYLELESLVRKYEDDLQSSFEKVSKMHPQILKLEKENAMLLEQNEKLRRKNEKLESKLNILQNRLYDKNIQRGDGIIHSIKSTQKSNNDEFRRIRDIFDIEIVGMDFKLEQFKTNISNVLSNQNNQLTEDSHIKLKSIYTHIGTILKRFNNIKESVQEMKKKMELLLRKKVDQTEKEVQRIKNRKFCNKKLSKARKSISTLDKVITDLNYCSKILSFEVIPRKSRQKAFNFVRNSVLELQSFSQKTKNYLSPLTSKSLQKLKEKQKKKKVKVIGKKNSSSGIRRSRTFADLMDSDEEEDFDDEFLEKPQTSSGRPPGGRDNIVYRFSKIEPKLKVNTRSGGIRQSKSKTKINSLKKPKITKVKKSPRRSTNYKVKRKTLYKKKK